MWIFLAFCSAIFAALTAILAKCGIFRTDSDVATAIRTVIVLFFSWIMVWVVDAQSQIWTISAKTLLFLILSGLATGASWLCDFRALQLGDVSRVVPIDKSSTVLTILLSMIILGETENFIEKLIGVAFIAFGILLMTWQCGNAASDSKRCLLYAFFSAVFAALTSILAKVGIEDIDSNLGTAIRTTVVLVLAFSVVFFRRKGQMLLNIQKREFLFICFSGIATGASWLCYYGALKMGPVSVVASIDKLSVVFTVLFSWLIFKEKILGKAWGGLTAITAGTLLMVLAQ